MPRVEGKDRIRHLLADGLAMTLPIAQPSSSPLSVPSGERRKLQMTHIKLSDSRALLIRTLLLQTHEMALDAHRHGFCHRFESRLNRRCLRAELEKDVSA